jgi:hypothetical protein
MYNADTTTPRKLTPEVAELLLDLYPHLDFLKRAQVRSLYAPEVTKLATIPAEAAFWNRLRAVAQGGGLR